MADQLRDRYRDLDATGRVQWLRQVAYAYARREGLDETNAEDCAQECLLRLLEELGPSLLPRKPVRDVDAWLRASVRHDVLDYARHLARERHEAVLLSVNADADDWPPEMEIPDICPTPEDALAKTLFWELLAPAIDALVDEEYVCFIRFYHLGQDAPSIATDEGTTAKHV
jgi:RNA polymerase sigma factor (sigma-70 family)